MAWRREAGRNREKRLYEEQADDRALRILWVRPTRIQLRSEKEEKKEDAIGCQEHEDIHKLNDKFNVRASNKIDRD